MKASQKDAESYWTYKDRRCTYPVNNELFVQQMEIDLVSDPGHREETAEVATPITFLVKTGTTGETRGELMMRIANVSHSYPRVLIVVLRFFLARKSKQVLSLISLAKRILMSSSFRMFESTCRLTLRRA